MNCQSQTDSTRRRPLGRKHAARSIACLILGMFFVMPLSAAATDADDEGAKAYWQTRYRGLHADVVRLRGDIARERELYADANRRNYRRGSKRHAHREAMMKAMAELGRVEADLATIEEDGRRDGALPGWFYEIDIELEDAGDGPNVPAAPGEDGGNPFYDDDSGD